jgi:hypothetical protein
MVYPMQMINFGPWHICERKRRRRKRTRTRRGDRERYILSLPLPPSHTITEGADQKCELTWL